MERGPNLLDLPIEIILYHVSSFFDSDTLDRFRNVCQCFRNLTSEIENRIDEIRIRKILERRDRFLARKEIWQKKRDLLLESERISLDDSFTRRLRSGTRFQREDFRKALLDLYEKGASGEKIPINELASFDTHAEISYDIFECSYNASKSANIDVETIKIQLDAQVPLECKRYLGNGGDKPEGFFAFCLGSKLINNNCTDFDEYFEVIKRMMRIYRDAGAKFNRNEKLCDFLRAVRFRLEGNFRSGGWEYSPEQDRIRILKFVKFLIDENGIDILETYDNQYGNGTKEGALIIMFQSPRLQFLIPHVINPFKILRNEGRTKKFGRVVSAFLADTRGVFLSTRSCRRVIKRILSHTEFRNILTVDRADSFRKFCFFLVLKKERKLLKFLLSIEDTRKMMVGCRDDDGNSLLHAVCSVRGKTERILLLFLQHFVAAVVNSGNKYNETPIMKSIQINQVECIKILLENGANLDLVDTIKKKSGLEMLNEKSWMKCRFKL